MLDAVHVYEVFAGKLPTPTWLAAPISIEGTLRPDPAQPTNTYVYAICTYIHIYVYMYTHICVCTYIYIYMKYKSIYQRCFLIILKR